MPASRSGILDRVLRGAYRAGFPIARAWWYLRCPGHEGAVVAVWLDGRILMVRHSYRNILGWPGGGIGRHETPKDAARRELAEEVGLEVDREALSFAMEMVGYWDYRRDHVCIFELRLSERPTLRPDNREVVAAEFMEPRTVLAQAVAPFIRRYLEEATGAAARG